MSPDPYVFPESASLQLKVVQDYMHSLATFDLNKLATLTTGDFRQITAPASLGVPARTKAEDLEFLGQLRDKLQNKPFEVSRAQISQSY
jgi:hypothetical protein